MAWLPAASTAVKNVATPALSSAAAPIMVPLSANSTVPVGVPETAVTVAVNETCCPSADGLMLAPNSVVVGAAYSLGADTRTARSSTKGNAARDANRRIISHLVVAFVDGRP